MPKNTLFSGKHISILGDSIGTLKGFLPPYCKSFYMQNPHADCSGISRPEDTWWVRVLAETGSDLCVNNSYSGSLVCGMDFPSATHLLRFGELHCNPGSYHYPTEGNTIRKKLCSRTILPDIIIVCMGANDWIFRSPITADSHSKNDFHYAYDILLRKLRNKYPESLVICTTVFQKDNAVPDALHPVGAYNDVIRSTAAQHQCMVADLAAYDAHIETIDGIHPTYQGMHTLAELWLGWLAEIDKTHNIGGNSQ